MWKCPEYGSCDLKTMTIVPVSIGRERSEDRAATFSTLIIVHQHHKMCCEQAPGEAQPPEKKTPGEGCTLGKKKLLRKGSLGEVSKVTADLTVKGKNVKA